MSYEEEIEKAYKLFKVLTNSKDINISKIIIMQINTLSDIPRRILYNHYHYDNTLNTSDYMELILAFNAYKVDINTKSTEYKKYLPLVRKLKNESN